LSTDLSDAALIQDSTRRRDPAFREKVLLAYQYRCSVCGHDLRLGRQTVGLEAAHIKWIQAQGPDIVPNGMALCSLHHKVFDLGAFTVLTDTYQIALSQHLHGSDEAAGRMLAYHGASLILPQSRDYLPQSEFLHWHRKWVFKEPSRENGPSQRAVPPLQALSPKACANPASILSSSPSLGRRDFGGTSQ